MRTINDDLLVFSKLGNLQMVKALAENGADVHVVNDSALRWAASNGQLNVVKYLIEQGADVNADDDYALRNAVNCGHLDTVKYLEGVMK